MLHIFLIRLILLRLVTKIKKLFNIFSDDESFVNTTSSEFRVDTNILIMFEKRSGFCILNLLTSQKPI